MVLIVFYCLSFGGSNQTKNADLRFTKLLFWTLLRSFQIQGHIKIARIKGLGGLGRLWESVPGPGVMWFEKSVHNKLCSIWDRKMHHVGQF